MLLKKVFGKLHIRLIIPAMIFTFCFVATAIFGVITALGAENYERMYALRVETGADSGVGDIGTFVIVYLDKDNVKRRAYINPYDGDYDKSVELAIKNNKSEASKGVNDFIKDALGYSVGNSDQLYVKSGVLPLDSHSVDTYFFRVPYEVKSIEAIGVMTMDGKEGGKSWDCGGLSLYKVNSIDGFVSYGNMSNNYELGFKGTLLEQMDFANSNGFKDLAVKFTFNQNGIKYLYNDKKTDITGGVSAWLVKSESKYTNLNSQSDMYTIKIDIADIYKAGFEGYVAGNKQGAKLSDVKPAELLVYKIDYLTKNKKLRTVNVPVLTSALAYAYEQGAINKDTALADIIGQSDSLAFTVCLPEFETIHDSYLYYVMGDEATLGDTTVESLTGMKATTDGATSHKKYYAAMDEDIISVRSVQIYDGDSAIGVSLDGASIRAEENSGAMMLYAAVSPDYKGYPLKRGGNQKLNYVAALNREQAGLADNRELYIFSAKTSTHINAETNSAIEAVINYIDTEDREKQYVLNFMDGANEFYGYWPDSSDSDAGYISCMQNGASIYAIMPIESVKKITGMTIKNLGKDSWTAENISIYKVEDNSKIGSIYYKWNDTGKGPNVIHGRVINGFQLDYSTDFNAIVSAGNKSGISIIASIGKKVSDADDASSAAGIYIEGNGEGRDINFTSLEISKLKDIRTNIFEYMFDMPFDVAKTKFGFDAKKVCYTVNVVVDSDPYGIANGTKYDDCGSANYFYFQLVFEKGKSAYVQANQQMPSDSFRSGKTETFSINVNQEYGAVQAVNIIPEVDVNTGKPYDKLNIKNVIVERVTDNGLSQSYETGTIGWIGIDYNDKGATENYHKASQLVKTFTITSEKNKANILFKVGYDSIPDDLAQFEGSISAEITYRKTDGSVDSAVIDVAAAMHHFNGTSGIAEFTSKTKTIKKGKKDSEQSVKQLAKTDPSLMVRPNHTDRFIWSGDDVKYVESIDFEFTNVSGEKAGINISNVSMQVILSGSVEKNRAINQFDEYIIEDGQFSETITANKQKHELKIDSKTPQSLKIVFENDESTCISAMGDGVLPYIVTRQPVTENDIVNIYAYVANNKDDLSRFNVEGTINYEDTMGSLKFAKDMFSLTTMLDDNGISRQVFASENLLVRNFDSLRDVGLYAYGSGTDVAIDYIIVQHIRNNVVIKTYKAYYKIPEPSIKDSTVFTNKLDEYKNAPGYQEVTIQLGNNMSEAALTAEYHDLAISLDYQLGSGTAIYHTENKYVTDLKKRTIKPGELITFRFDYINNCNITGVTISSTDYLPVDVKAVTIGVYTPAEKNTTGNSETEYECTKWYSIDCNQTVNNESKRFGVTAIGNETLNAWKLINVKAKTLSSYSGGNGSIGSGVGLGGSQKLEMIITYEHNGKLENLAFEDVIAKVTDGDFGAGSTAQFSFLAQNLRYENIKKITFRPYDNNADNVAVWGLDTLDITFSGDNKRKDNLHLEANKVFYENGSNSGISLTNVLLSATVQKVEAQYSGNNTIIASTVIEDYGTVNQNTNDKIRITDFEAGQVYKITVDAQNTTMGYSVEADKNFRKIASIDGALYYSYDGSVGENKTIKIIANENTECFLELTFN